MKSSLCKLDYTNCRCSDKALLAIRLVAGIVFFVHGYGKLTGNPSVEMFAGMLGNIGFPLPLLFAWIVALTETFGGLALILGVFVRPAAILLAVVMTVAFGAVKKFSFPAGELDFVLLGVSIGLAYSGPGHLSLAYHKIMSGKTTGKGKSSCDECGCGCGCEGGSKGGCMGGCKGGCKGCQK